MDSGIGWPRVDFSRGLKEGFRNSEDQQGWQEDNQESGKVISVPECCLDHLHRLLPGYWMQTGSFKNGPTAIVNDGDSDKEDE